MPKISLVSFVSFRLHTYVQVPIHSTARPNTFLRPKNKIENLQSGRKIVKIARIWMIFGPNESRRRELKFEKISCRQKNEQTNEKTKKRRKTKIRKKEKSNIREKYSDGRLGCLRNLCWSCSNCER